ncbi:MAG: putative manganese-dependent inorganic diphosphatase [Lachnospiraceae bacterium]|nr:putative manganese-dependent inorganic diphosphatase [Lachnospiraceae bacterium]
MNKKNIWIVGHKNPDTDSICAAIAYADLKNKIDSEHNYIPKRAGEVNAETAYVLKTFGVEEPDYIENVGTQLKDIVYTKTMGVSGQISMKKAWELMKEMKVVTLPVVNDRNKLEGLIVTGDIAKSYMDVYDSSALSTARTQYKNIMETLAGTVITGNDHGYFIRGKVIVATGSAEVTRAVMEPDDLVIVGDNEETQLACIEEGCSCLIITNGQAISAKVMTVAVKREVVIISSPYDSYTVARLINQSIPIKYFMTKENIVCFELDDYVDEVRETTAKIRYRAFPLLDENQNYVGIFSRRNLLDTQKKQVILVDHNEKSQAVENIDEAEILEIIDHHRLGALETIAPVYFRNQPLGCTSTIIYQMYQEKGVEINPTIAGLLCAAIISDTLMFRSPTCTELDVQAARELAKIADIEIEIFALNMFEAGSDFEHKTEEEILNQDFKIFRLNDVSCGVAQVSAMSQSELEKVYNRIKSVLPSILLKKKLDMVFVMLTDIMSESTTLVYCGESAEELVKDSFVWRGEMEDSVIVDRLVSRKKQFIPALMKTLTERLN